MLVFNRHLRKRSIFLFEKEKKKTGIQVEQCIFLSICDVIHEQQLIDDFLFLDLPE